MAYIVPKEMPKSCHDCQFHYCSEYHPFWSADKEKRNTQTIRCQAIEPFRSTILDIADKAFKADWCPLVDAAEVVPKSEVDRLNAVMKDMDEQRAYTINMLGENLENAKSEVERLQAENETLKDNNEHLSVFLEESKQAYANYEETTGLKQAKQAYAKEIISEMDNRLHDMAMEYANRGHKAYFAVCEMVHHKVIRPVEKKYAEGKT